MDFEGAEEDHCMNLKHQGIIAFLEKKQTGEKQRVNPENTTTGRVNKMSKAMDHFTDIQICSEMGKFGAFESHCSIYLKQITKAS